MNYLEKSLLWLSHEQWLLNPGWWLVRGLYYPLYQGSSYPTSVMEWPLIIRGASTQGPHPLVSRPMTSSDGESRSKLTSSISFWNGHAQKSLGLSIDPEICVNDRCLMKSTAEKLLYPHRHWICFNVSLLVKYVDYPHDQMGTTFLRDSSFQGNPAIFFPDGVLRLGYWDILGYTLWEFSISIEDGSFIDDLFSCSIVEMVTLHSYVKLPENCNLPWNPGDRSWIKYMQLLQC